ncbi:uncharacterized protein LOC107030097 [Solanum pennellii]|uniref:Uncharacterized protein LOC107030097 n=1 Tax=Solanum pennellii TaxID=28526 RepID=A0ABM1HKX8_SOLPN|nr:uncharacterized protein LOC107030097 [Solanum pennellii]
MNKKEKLTKDDGVERVQEGSNRILIGCLMYLTATMPDILNDVSVLSRFMNHSSEFHKQAAKGVLRYVKRTMDFGVKFRKCRHFKHQGFSDSDWGSSAKGRKVKLQGIILFLALDAYLGLRKNKRFLLNQLQRLNAMLLRLRSIKVYG